MQSRTNLIDFILSCMSRFIGNCAAIVVAFVIIFIGLHIYGYVVIGNAIRAIGESTTRIEQKAKKDLKKVK